MVRLLGLAMQSSAWAAILPCIALMLLLSSSAMGVWVHAAVHAGAAVEGIPEYTEEKDTRRLRQARLQGTWQALPWEGTSPTLPGGILFAQSACKGLTSWLQSLIAQR